MDWKLEVAVIPVTDVDRAKQFYSEKLGFNVDVDNVMGNDFRNVQLTPHGSACSVTIGTGLTPGLQLCVYDAAAARAELAGRGVEVSTIQHIEDGTWAEAVRPLRGRLKRLDVPVVRKPFDVADLEATLRSALRDQS